MNSYNIKQVNMLTSLKSEVPTIYVFIGVHHRFYGESKKIILKISSQNT